MKKAAAIPKTVDDYLAGVPEPARTTLAKVRAAIRSALPQEAEEVISYQMPMVKYRGMLLGYAAFKDHCSLFFATSNLPDSIKEDVSKYQTSKGTLQFPLDKPLPAALVKKITKARILQNELKPVKKR